MEGNEQPSPSPYPLSSNSSSSCSLLNDISNFKTPKRSFCAPNFTSTPCPQFFTASKQTPRPSPSSSVHHHHPRSSLSARPKQKTATARRLRAFELEQSQSSRKAQIKKEQSLKSLAKSLTTWLNFLFQNPRSCGCELSISGDRDVSFAGKLGKRDAGPTDGVVGVDAAWRSPKRQRDLRWQGSNQMELKGEEGFSSSKYYGSLRNSLKDVCSFDDLKQRMSVYFSLATCKEIFDVMTQVVKNIDEGRLKMKPHCPMVTDVGMKEKAIRLLMCYNPIWLRVGLYIIFGGDLLLPSGDVNSDQEIAFLKMIIEKQFFSHAGLAKAYAYNKMVEGLYRPGYYENLGHVILKRFLLLVLLLDRAKSHSALSLKYGIDGIDGGSPLLFLAKASIKSSHQMINDFLSSDNLLGEGNLLAHLVIIGYKVSYQQCPLVEYDFRVVDLFLDLQDGVRLCRAIQLLQNDSSILMKMVVPSDTRKKNMVNCGVALQYLKQTGLALHDEDGMMITEDDIANGDKELTISLLWNIFVHFQLPLLINRAILSDEILKIQGFNMAPSNSISLSSSSLDLLLNWIQAVCEKYDNKVDSFSSLVDGKAIWCMLDYYFRKELYCSHSLKDPHDKSSRESIMSATDYTDAVHNFILSQKLITLLGNFPEVLQISDILEHSGAITERSVVVLLVFLASQLTAKQTLDKLNFHKLLCCDCQSPERRQSSTEIGIVSLKAAQDLDELHGQSTEDAAGRFKAIKAWWQTMAERNNRFITMPATATLQQKSARSSSISIERGSNLDITAATEIQLSWKNDISSRSLHHLAATKIQRHFRGWLLRSKFLKKKHFITKIQSNFRRLRCQRNFQQLSITIRSAIIIQSHLRGSIARRVAWRYRGLIGLLQKSCRCWLIRRDFLLQREAAIKIQCAIRSLNCQIAFHCGRNAATEIQRFVRGQITRKRLLGASNFPVATIGYSNFQTSVAFIQSSELKIVLSSILKVQRWWRGVLLLKVRTKSTIIIQSYVRGWIGRQRASRERHYVVTIQKFCRCWLIRRHFLLQREAAIRIQCAIWSINCRKGFLCCRNAATEIQRFVRGQITRKRLLEASNFPLATIGYLKFQTSVPIIQSSELKIMLSSILKVQRWWRVVLLLKVRTKAAITIQSYVRGRIGRQRASRERHYVVTIQSHWKGYLARKESREQLVDLRLRVQRSARNVDDSMRIINRLKMALSELLTMKSISGILHTCATLDMTTGHSQKCCEELVAAGAISILLKLIRSVSRSIPDQEVLKHALATIRNLTRYQHLTEVLIDCHGSIEIIFWEFLRNKEEGYFIASDILKKICSNQRGAESLHNLPALLKRLHNLVEEQARKATIEKRNLQGMAAREKAERRWREAVGLLKLITTS